MKDMIGYCGLDCEKCDAYIATVNDDQALREKTAKLWAKLNNAPILPEHINCEGCRMSGVKTVFCEHICEIRKCALKKRVFHLRGLFRIRKLPNYPCDSRKQSDGFGEFERFEYIG